MPVPKKRLPKGRRNRRRSHHALVKAQTVTCASCGAAVLPHRACDICGQYKGRDVMKGQQERVARVTQRKQQRAAQDKQQ